MADNLIFPIGFDLEEAVKKAGQEWNSTYADKLEKLLAKRAITVNLGFSTKNLNNLDDVKRRLAELKIEPLTPENKTAIRDLVRELKELARIMEKIQKFKGIELPELQMAKAAKLRKDVAQADEKLRLSQERVRQSEERLILSQQRAAQQADRTSKAYGTQSGYLERLIKRMAIYASFSYAGNFLTSVREVTAQFELQRVSLGAILQDANKGAQIFSQIKQFALKSPISILDLTKYTKQLAAYKIGYDELFDTTKRLADISVGLGVDFQRLTLLYGQVRATGYLRASEVRQATEAGIPLVEELAAKLTKANGELVTAADVMDMISKRAISFDMVKDVFTDMTSAGGAFYQMQEKQGNTLYGLWAKLGDAASVMYEQIGNTESVNSGMKTAIGLLTELMRNWKAVAQTAQWVIIPNAALLALYKYSTATQRVEAAQSAAATATERRKAAVLQLSAAIEKGSVDDINAANAALQKAEADEVAAQKATTRMGLLKSGFISVAKSIGAGLGIGLVIGAVTTLAYKLFEAYENAHRLDRKLDEIDAERITLTSQSVRNFEYLADVAVKAADGSKKQKDALDELHRTYRDMIPVQDLTIEHLRQLREGTNSASEAYKSLTTAIREYISEQQKQKKLSAIEEEYGSTITDKYKKLYSELTKGIRINVGGSKIKSWIELQFSPEEFERAMVEFEKRATDKTKSVGQKIKESFAAIGFDLTPDQIKALQKVGKWGEFDDGYFTTLNNALEEQAERINAVHTGYAGFVGDLGKYGAEMSRIADVMENKIYKANGKVFESNSFLRKQMQSNEWIKEWTNSLKTNLSSAGIEIKNEWFNFVKRLNPSDPNAISSINFDAILEVLNTDAIRKKLGKHYEQTKNYVLAIQNEYQDLVPQNRTVSAMRARLMQIANTIDKTGGIMNDLQRHLMKSGDNWENYSKSVRDAVKDYEAQIDEMKKINASIKKGEKGVGPLDPSKYSDEEIKKVQLLVEALKQLFPFLAPEKSSGGSTKSDPRLQILNEMVQLAEKLNKEYSDWEKKVGSTKALEKVNETYAETVKYAEQVAKDAGISLPHLKTPTNTKELNEYLEAVRKIMESAKGLKGGKKAAIELAVKMSNNVSAEDQKAIEEKIKALADRISRTKTAKEFYEKILSAIGDRSIASKVAESIFGQNGSMLQKAIVDQVRGMTNKIELPEGIISADNIIDYKALRQFAEANKKELGGMYDELVKISEQGQKDLTKTYEGYLKDLEKAKTYSDKRIELARYTANRIAEIEKSTLPQSEKERLTAGYREREKQEQGELEWEAFKDMPMYVQMFDDLDNASSTMLSNMKAKLLELQSVWGSTLNPTQLKELQSRLSEIDAQLAKKNPFKSLSDSMKQYKALSKDGTQADAERKLIEATNKRQAAQQKLNMALDVSRTAQERYNEAVAKYGADSAQAKSAKLFWDAAKQGVDDAGKLVEQTGLSEKEAQRLVNAWKKVKDAIGLSLGEVFQITHSLGDLAGGIGKLTEVFGGDEEDVQYWNDIASSLNEVTSGIGNMVQAALSANPIEVVTSAVTAIPNIISGFAGLFSAGKVRKANKEIKRQQELLDQLEYTYGRLEKAADKLFGRDYINNYQQQMKNLRAQADAYQKQADAERSKGKKKDEEKIKEFEEKRREALDQLADMQEDLVTHFTGSSRTDVARQMAKSWIDARASMSDTFAAIKGDYQDMIKNMLVEGAAARVIENALSKVWDDMDAMLKKNDVQGAIDSLVNGMDSALNAANNGMEVLWKALEARGYDMKQLIGETDSEYTGIAKSVAGATSEEINNVAAIGNTLMYYVSPIPRIDENLARVVALMEGRSAALPMASGAATGAVDYTEMFTTANQHLSSLPRMEQHLAEIHTMLGRALKTKGATTGFNTFLNP